MAINKKFISLVALSLMLLSLGGCALSQKNNTLKDEDYVAGKLDGADFENTYNLSNGEALQIESTIDGNEIFLVPQSVYTNSEEITVTNNSDVDLNIYLYSETNLSDPIRQVLIRSNKKETFTGLASCFIYDIGVDAEDSTQFSITITD